MNTRIVAVALAFIVATCAHAQVSDQQLVNNAFPSTLDDGDGARFSRFIAVDLNHDGHPLLVAVYTNLAGGAIRVLNRAGQVLSAPALPGMRGFHANVRAVDLDGDGVPEVVAEFTTGHSPDNPDTWVFRWTGTALQLISPTCQVGNLTLTCLGRVSLLDLNGDGKLSLLDWPAFTLNQGNVAVAGNWTVYSLSGGMFKQMPDTFAFAREFRRAKGEPINSEWKFAASLGATTLRVVNGTGDAVTSGHILLNGTEVLGPDDFKRNQHTYEVPVTTALENTIRVRLDSKPGSGLTVLVGKAASAAP